MSIDSLLGIFQGIQTLFATEPVLGLTRVFLMFLGMALVYLGKKGTLEPLLMIPMGLRMATVNAAVMFFNPLS